MSNPTETSALLPNGRNGSNSNPSFAHRIKTLIAAEGEPSWYQSYKFFIFGSWLNLFLLFVPLSVVSHYLQLDAALRFSFSFHRYHPIGKVAWGSDGTDVGEAGTDSCLGFSTRRLETLWKLSSESLLCCKVNSELSRPRCWVLYCQICSWSWAALSLPLGLNSRRVIFKSPLRKLRARYRYIFWLPKLSTNHIQLMTLACITLVIPAAYHSTMTATDGGIANLTMFAPTDTERGVDQAGLLVISRGTALLLLGVYVAYLFFQLKTHAYLFEAEEQEAETPKMSTVSAGVALLATTVITSFCADYLVASIEETAERYSIPKAFIGLILLPIVANAAEHVTSIWMAMKGQMELTIGICVGSSIQIATFVVPLLVIVGWIAGHELTLFFANFETITLFASVFLVNTLIQDGKSNYMEGLMLVTLYFVIALAFWVA
ncbi:Sodium/calcium exchanger protein-domain-containing protein [Mycena rebaudengoi]|nr:Sodium/calcium exchanger protein-domain-containing protein [Mycena rebaudengoi]